MQENQKASTTLYDICKYVGLDALVANETHWSIADPESFHSWSPKATDNIAYGVGAHAETIGDWYSSNPSLKATNNKRVNVRRFQRRGIYCNLT